MSDGNPDHAPSCSGRHDPNIVTSVEHPRFGFNPTPLVEPPSRVQLIGGELDRLRANRARMLDYLKLKLDENDMHGVQDAASDIRDLDAKIEALTWAKGDRG